ncbi:hypothetical protein J437_LFUL002701 [Ladona fulva]|uniref:Nuclear receptor domain-containing protein n=1 Tax=Ladona fulva TaxID=123851 RepID=A0A8K0NV42_LADFU|nr:hypothetical protein J437_LFUL002701 [Ladona fulva]
MWAVRQNRRAEVADLAVAATNRFRDPLPSPKGVSSELVTQGLLLSKSRRALTVNGCKSPFAVRKKCHVCGDISSSEKFGSFTCKPCRLFIWRTLNGKKRYTCSKSGECSVEIPKRSKCSYCRFKKCTNLWMISMIFRMETTTGKVGTRELKWRAQVMGMQKLLLKMKVRKRKEEDDSEVEIERSEKAESDSELAENEESEEAGGDRESDEGEEREEARGYDECIGSEESEVAGGDGKWTVNEEKDVQSCELEVYEGGVINDILMCSAPEWPPIPTASGRQNKTPEEPVTIPPSEDNAMLEPTVLSDSFTPDILQPILREKLLAIVNRKICNENEAISESDDDLAETVRESNSTICVALYVGMDITEILLLFAMIFALVFDDYD